MLDTERPHADNAPAAAVLVGVPGDHAVVHHRTLRRVHADVAGPVELRLDLSDLGGHELVVVDERVVPERAARRGAGNAHLPAACAEGRRLAVVVLADRDRLILLDGGQSARDVGRVFRVVGRARSIGRAPLGRRPLLVYRLVGDRPLQRLRDGQRGQPHQAHRQDRFAENGTPHGLLLRVKVSDRLSSRALDRARPWPDHAALPGRSRRRPAYAPGRHRRA